MALSKDLFQAILSMDSYNRGYGAGINFGVASDAVNTEIGEARIIATRGQSDAQAVGFYGLAYDTGSVSNFQTGEKTIAYRGTNANTFADFLTDAWNGYGVGAGSLAGKQAELALRLYQPVGRNSVSIFRHLKGQMLLKLRRHHRA